jgi:hypothetical protein
MPRRPADLRTRVRANVRIDERVLMLALVLASTLAGCAGRGPRARPAPGTPTVERVTDPIAAPWLVHRSSVPVTQTLHVAAVIESRVDTSTSVDTLQSQLTATWSSPMPGYPRRFTGVVTDYRLSRAMGDSLLVPDGIALPIAFVADQAGSGRQARFTVPDESACGTPDAVIVQGVRDLWLSLPDTIGEAMTWSDSTSQMTCRDSIPIMVTARRDFRVTGAMLRGGAVVLTVERRSRSHLAGSGTQFGDSVAISGEGTGAAMFEVSLATGTAVFASGESTLRIELRGSRRTQSLLQRSRISLLGR